MNVDESKRKTKTSKNSSAVNNKGVEEMSPSKKLIGDNRYTLYKNKLLGEGSFGKVFLGKVNDTNDINKERQMIVSHIKTKLSSYKQQDILKKKFSTQDFVSYSDVIGLLTESNMKCYYCSCETYLLYEIVREMKQWSLDRINNDIGHNKNNLVICCLECNLKRRRTNKDAFFFTKNLKIQKMD